MTHKLVLLFLSALLCAGCAKPSGGEGGMLTQEIKGLKMYEFRSGKTEWQVTAKKATLSDRTEMAELTSPTVEIRKNDKLAARIKAHNGTVDMAGRVVTLTNSVEGMSEEEKVAIVTEKLIYDIPGDRIWTNEPIKLTRNGVTVRGRGFTAKPDLSEIEIRKQETSLPENINPAELTGHE